VADTL